MHTRVPCNRCREGLLVTPNTTTIRCPKCEYENKIVTLEGLNTQNEGKSFPLGSLVAKIKTNISCSSNGSPKYESLNCKPLPLASPNSRFELGPRKRALLIGVTYKGKYKLKGTIIDVKSMRDLLIKHFKFRQENILVLTEKESEPELTPTKKNIQNSMKWLVTDSQAGDSLVFYFSGHGVRQPDFENNELDGYDETICPADFMQEGLISDNEIYSTIILPLKKDVTLNAIVDACHSGSVLDLSYVYSRERKDWEKNTVNDPKNQKIDGLAISISACQDEQVAADTAPCIGNSNMNGGAMTNILIDVVKNNHSITYGELLDSIHTSIDKANQGCLLARIFKRVFNNMLLQKPLLSTSEKFQVYERRFVL